MQFWRIPGIILNFSITMQRSLVRTVKITLLRSQSSIVLKTSECSKGGKFKSDHFLKSSGSLRDVKFDNLRIPATSVEQ